MASQPVIIIINSSPSVQLEGNKKERESLYQEASTTCAELAKAGERKKNAERDQIRPGMFLKSLRKAGDLSSLMV